MIIVPRSLQTAVHEAVKHHAAVARLLGELPRSPLWRGVEHRFVVRSPWCAACGSHAALNVHHVAPFLEHPELELADGTGVHCQLKNHDGTYVCNLITLCRGGNDCHLRLGHGDDFKAYNPDVRADAVLSLANPRQREALWAAAKAKRLYATARAA